MNFTPLRKSKVIIPPGLWLARALLWGPERTKISVGWGCYSVY